jgi:hypothetical protein
VPNGTADSSTASIKADTEVFASAPTPAIGDAQRKKHTAGNLGRRLDAE